MMITYYVKFKVSVVEPHKSVSSYYEVSIPVKASSKENAANVLSIQLTELIEMSKGSNYHG